MYVNSCLLIIEEMVSTQSRVFISVNETCTGPGDLCIHRWGRDRSDSCVCVGRLTVGGELSVGVAACCYMIW